MKNKNKKIKYFGLKIEIKIADLNYRKNKIPV